MSSLEPRAVIISRDLSAPRDWINPKTLPSSILEMPNEINKTTLILSPMIEVFIKTRILELKKLTPSHTKFESTNK